MWRWLRELCNKLGLLGGANRVDLESFAEGWEGLSNKLTEEKERVAQSLALAVDAAQMGQWDFDLVHDSSRRSLRHDQIFGYASLQPEWGWQAFMNHVAPEDRQSVIEQFHNASQQGATFNIECRIVWADQSVHWIATQGRAYLNDQGVPTRMVGVVIDITERKQVEETRRQSEQRTRLIIDASMDAIIAADDRGRIIEWNPHAEVIFGWCRAEVIGRSLAEIVIPERYRERHRKGMEHFLATEEGPILNQRLELVALRKDGSEFPIELTMLPLRIGSRFEFSAFLRDLSAPKQAEESMRRNRAILDAIHLAQSQFILAEDPLAFFAEFLKSLLTLTNSEYGFIDEMFYDADGEPFLTARAITDISWNEESRRMYQQFLNGTLNFNNLKSLYGEVMASAKPVIANDAAQDPRRTGIPSGHPPLTAFLGLPLLSNSQEFVGVIGLANRPGGYSEEVIPYLEPMVAACANLIAARKNDQRRQQAEHDLRRARDELELRVQERTVELKRANLALQAEATERQLAAQALREIDERLNLALQSSGTGTWSWNVVENSIIWDDYIHPLFGLKPGTFPGRYEDFLRMVHADDQQRVAQEVTLAVENDVAYDTEFQVVWPQGSIRVLGARGKVYRDAAGRALRMTGICWDITERKRLEERFRVVVESTPIAEVMIDAVGTIVLVNQKTEQLFGYGRDELLGKAVEMLLPERYRLGHPQLRNGFFAHPQARSMGAGRELYGLCKDGTEVPIEIGLGPIQTEEGLYVLAAIMDITVRKQALETVVRQAQELARSNTELEQFAYIASHDLQEPLRKVQTFGDMLVAKSGEALGEEGRDYLKRMQNAAQRMQRLINDLLSFARVTSQAKPFVPVELTRVAQEVVSDLEARIKSTGGRVELGELPRLEGDPLQMRQLLQNLIGNALKFHRVDVPPVVAVQSRIVNNSTGVNLQHAPSALFCEVTVQDNGIGFDEKYLDRIFAPFQRLHGRGQYEGTGIGLAICRKIAERHLGTITARSTPGQGTTFIVTLPLRHVQGVPNHA